MSARFMYPRQKAALKLKMFANQCGRCCYCGRAIELHPKPWPMGARTPDRFATIEHLQRVADGGSNDPDNLALACFVCNGARGDLSWVEFKTILSQQVAA